MLRLGCRPYFLAALTGAPKALTTFSPGPRPDEASLLTIKMTAFAVAAYRVVVSMGQPYGPVEDRMAVC